MNTLNRLYELYNNYEYLNLYESDFWRLIYLIKHINTIDEIDKLMKFLNSKEQNMLSQGSKT